jgi:hypothetical protein
LLYIEAVYQIKQRNDSLAKNILQTLIAQNPGSPLAKKAQNLVEVLGRRKQIEDELTRLKIDQPKEDSVVTRRKQGPIVQRKPVMDSAFVSTLPKRERDSISKLRNDVSIRAVPRSPIDTIAKKPLVKPTLSSVYQFDPAVKHYAMIILDKVDVVFISEAKNAFTRYNQEKYYNQVYSVNTVNLDENRKLLLIGDFANAQAAIDWMLQAKRLAPNEIVPWLKQDKYSFSIMTDWNLEVLKNKKDIDVYNKFLQQKMPGKF